MKARTRAWWIRGGVAAGLALVFWSYLNPHLVVELSNRLWACF